MKVVGHIISNIKDGDEIDTTYTNGVIVHLTDVNLPRYAIAWQDKLTYRQFREKYNTKPLLSHQLPQCHICTRFHTDNNPLFAYSIFKKGNDYRLIYRCQSGHGHDRGMVLIDIQTGLEMHL